ncbi:nitronate monooxygenase [Ferrovibrio sp.]|uniref:NAD(P)H-dependent flavin oxidoreductase n=1 Tax=Ferrovibrio sp. TaxID=1917215 RepID=UPI001B3CCDA6|nr:nitronate monooxygenase [Ferrovibrio sp.]MBP7065703.1 nitronate monooxygenase [Ferrovibrio sp.]
MLPSVLTECLRLPVLASPLFLISGPDLVVETCRAGVIGSFPSFNQRTSAGYEDWLRDIRARLRPNDAPWAAQFAVHRTNNRLEADLALTVKYQVPILITALGITREVTDAVHAYGGLVFHDAINMQHARKALEMNVDGIIAVCNGAGGHAGTYNPFAFIGELRPLMGNKTLILSGCISDGSSVASAIAAGADLAYIGTRFINTAESMASAQMKQLVIESSITDIIYSAEVDGVGANWLRQTLPSRGNLRAGGEVGSMNVTDVLGEPKRWRDILSAGQGVGAIHDTPPVAELIARMECEYLEATDRLAHSVRQRRNQAYLAAGHSYRD